MMEPRIDCAYDAMVDVGQLVLNPKNPNKHPKKQIELLAKILSHCWRNPIVVSNRSGFIVKGHARLEAARLAGINPVPVDYQDYVSEAEEYADLIADNRLAELTEPDLPMLKDLLESLDDGSWDMDLTGFDTKALEELMTQFHIPEDNKDIDEEAMRDTKNECPKCGFKW